MRAINERVAAGMGIGVAAAMLGGIGWMIVDSASHAGEAGEVATEVRQEVEVQNTWSQPLPDEAYHLPRCKEDDGAEGSCVYVATEQGNGVGESFYIDGEGNVLPLNDQQAKALTGEL